MTKEIICYFCGRKIEGPQIFTKTGRGFIHWACRWKLRVDNEKDIDREG